MKKILGLGVVAMLVMALVAGGTWAYFSDYQSSVDNVLTAGTLDVGLSNANGQEMGGDASAIWSMGNMSPGGPTSTGILYIANNGTIPIVTVNLTASFNVSGTVPNVKSNGTGDTELIEKMIKITAASWNATDNPASLVGKSIYDLSTNNYTLPTGIAPGVQYALSLTWGLSNAATNGCQNRTATMNVTVYGFQN